MTETIPLLEGDPFEICEFTLLDAIACAHCKSAESNRRVGFERGPNVETPRAGEEWTRAEALRVLLDWRASGMTIDAFSESISWDKGDKTSVRSASAIATSLHKGACWDLSKTLHFGVGR